jgi:dihydrofolate synthase/folylpolyglutamate synthase
MTYEQALDYIHSVCWKGSRPGLARITELMDKLGNAQNTLKFIHVAGTNGKGSTSAMLASVLGRAGYKVGLFTSPFIVRFNERMRIDGVDIDDQELADITAYVKPFAESMEDVPTEFELITAIAFVYFARHGCDYVVLECGMGGRLDSTNIISPASTVLSIITGIAMDHTAFLGDTPEKIAAEKAGIIKKGVPVLFGGVHDPIGVTDGMTEVDPISCEAVIKNVAEDVGAPYVRVDSTKLKNVRCALDGARLDFEQYNDLYIPLPGIYQPYNAATVLSALALLRECGVRIPDDAVREGLAAVRWAGRFEILSDEPLLISDGGHNPEGIDAAIGSAKAYFGEQKIQLLSGVMADKDYAYMVRRMSEVAMRVYTVRPDNSRALDADAYANVFAQNGIEAHGFETVHDAVFAAMADGLRDGVATLCLGSLYMYGEVKAAVEEYQKGCL